MKHHTKSGKTLHDLGLTGGIQRHATRKYKPRNQDKPFQVIAHIQNEDVDTYVFQCGHTTTIERIYEWLDTLPEGEVIQVLITKNIN